ncbi:MAG: hypothetical protein IPI98_02575 [Chitinophagaceae bacterium]|nr:hypothetical protein [Chitinophagaceae bacterium]
MKTVHQISKEFLAGDNALDSVKSMLSFKPRLHAFVDNSMFFGRKNCMTVYFSSGHSIRVFIKSYKEDIERRMTENMELNNHLKSTYYNFGLDGDDFAKSMVTIEVNYILKSNTM